MKVHLLSENTVIVLSQQVISQDNFKSILSLQQLVKSRLNDVLIDVIPSYASLHLTFNLVKISAPDFLQGLDTLLKDLSLSEELTIESKTVEIPVYYGKEVGLDIDAVAGNAGLSIDDVIDTHSSTSYQVFSIGFAPGFAFLGSVDEKIAMPRKATPRTKVPQGSLGIADTQTAIYPSDSPGGWQIIGRTPMKLIDFGKNPITPLQIGDQVKFVPITKDEFTQQGGVV